MILERAGQFRLWAHFSFFVDLAKLINMQADEWQEQLLPDGRIRWRRRYVTIEKRAEDRYFCRIQIAPIGYSSQRTFNKRAECEVWARNRLAEKNRLGTEALPGQREITELRKLKQQIGDVDLGEVARHWLLHNPTNKKTVWKALDAYESIYLPQLAKTTRNNYTSKVGWLRSVHEEETMLSAVTRADLAGKLGDLPVKPVTRNGYRRFVRAFFSWCCDQGWLKISPAEQLGGYREEGKPVSYLSAEEAKRFIRTAEAKDPELVPLLTLMMFGGIRPEIVLRMAPRLDELIDLEDKCITVPAYLEEGVRINKSGEYVIEEDFPGDIWSWLVAYWDGRPLCIQNFQKRRLEVSKAAEVKLHHDILRHTFGTFDYADCRNMDKVAGDLGHATSTTTAKYYVNRTAKGRDARNFFSLRPLPGAIPVRRERVNPHATKADWPCDAILVEWVEARGKVGVAMQLGVSEAAVRKRLKRIQESNH